MQIRGCDPCGRVWLSIIIRPSGEVQRLKPGSKVKRYVVGGYRPCEVLLLAVPMRGDAPISWVLMWEVSIQDRSVRGWVLRCRRALTLNARPPRLQPLTVVLVGSCDLQEGNLGFIVTTMAGFLFVIFLRQVVFRRRTVDSEVPLRSLLDCEPMRERLSDVI